MKQGTGIPMKYTGEGVKYETLGEKLTITSKMQCDICCLFWCRILRRKRRQKANKKRFKKSVSSSDLRSFDFYIYSVLMVKLNSSPKSAMRNSQER